VHISTDMPYPQVCRKRFLICRQFVYMIRAQESLTIQIHTMRDTKFTGLRHEHYASLRRFERYFGFFPKYREDPPVALCCKGRTHISLLIKTDKKGGLRSFFQLPPSGQDTTRRE